MQNVFSSRGVECRMELSHSVKMSRDLLAEAVRDGYDSLWIGGGDGTINHILNATVGQFASYGIVPMGTINGLARALGIPRDPLEAVQWLLDGEPTSLDLGMVGDRYFVLYATIGFHAAVFHGTNPRLKRLVGRAAFFAAGAVEACRAGGLPQFKITGKKVESVENGCRLLSSQAGPAEGDRGNEHQPASAPVTDIAEIERKAVETVGVDLGEPLGGAETVDAALAHEDPVPPGEEELAEPKLASETVPLPSDIEPIRREGYSLVLSNFCNFSGFGAVREGDVCDSSFLQAHLFESCKLWPMLRFFSTMRYRRPRQDDPGVEHFRVTELTVRSDQRLLLQVDGEPVHLGDDREFAFVCVPKAIQVLWNREAVLKAAQAQEEERIS